VSANLHPISGYRHPVTGYRLTCPFNCFFVLRREVSGYTHEPRVYEANAEEPTVSLSPSDCAFLRSVDRTVEWAASQPHFTKGVGRVFIL
jgi:hypothetical protein